MRIKILIFLLFVFLLNSFAGTIKKRKEIKFFNGNDYGRVLYHTQDSGFEYYEFDYSYYNNRKNLTLEYKDNVYYSPFFHYEIGQLPEGAKITKVEFEVFTESESDPSGRTGDGHLLSA